MMSYILLFNKIKKGDDTIQTKYNILYYTEQEIQDNMNQILDDWRVKIRILEDIKVMLIHTSYTDCTMEKLCKILNIKPYEQICIHKVDSNENNWDFYKNIDYIINLELLKKMRCLNEVL